MSPPATDTVLQLAPVSGPPLAVIGTFVLAAVFYGTTAYLAARYVLGEAPVLPAAWVGVILAAVALLLGPFGPLTVIAVSLAVDLVAIKGLFGLEWRETALVTLGHYVLGAILGVAVFNLVRLLSGPPG